MSAYDGGGTGSGNTHTPQMISGRKATPAKTMPAKVVRKAAPRKATAPKKSGA